ncbi:hypothetical protein BO78DRAFT_45840 [Aspergillus sclerotiicarbonarius CBS 121057]|uniref:SHSP domain-containing protein n=1 Tax=Aspergillus sclerotiicarbonarius (strain CBS 121057 / IBT 28362) TaxID=1448318 RepID=A0A319EHJ6_ASPSB|nr:hypothetical protein BO78DRAFT_45840 [Aspergillus sclerotiicarbonarius CBS 121057]
MATIGARERAGGLHPLLRAPLGAPRPMSPAFDVRLLDGGYYLDGELAGAKKEDIVVQIDDQTLVISGTIKRGYPEPPPDFQPDLTMVVLGVYPVPLDDLVERMLPDQTDARQDGREGTCFASAGRGAPTGGQDNRDDGAAPNPDAQADRGDQDARGGQLAAGVRNNLGGLGAERRAHQRGDRIQRGVRVQRGDANMGRPRQGNEGNQQIERVQRGNGNTRGRGRGRGEGIQRRGTIPVREGIQRRGAREGEDDGAWHAEHRWKLCEREVGPFSRSFNFDKPIQQKAEVRFHDGILTIWVPLEPTPEPFRLPVYRD